MGVVIDINTRRAVNPEDLLYGRQPLSCPVCGIDKMKVVAELDVYCNPTYIESVTCVTCNHVLLTRSEFESENEE